MKPVKFSSHARWQMELRGASEEEVVHAIKSVKWEDAKMNKFQSKHKFDFNKIAPTIDVRINNGTAD